MYNNRNTQKTKYNKLFQIPRSITHYNGHIDLSDETPSSMMQDNIVLPNIDHNDGRQGIKFNVGSADVIRFV